MVRQARRVVTGHDSQGKSIVLSDGPPPNVRDRGTLVDFIEMWSTEEMPAPIRSTEPEPTDGPLRIAPSAHGTRFRVNEFHPGHIKHLKPRADGRHPMMHRTQSIDYGIVLEGELYLILDDKEVLLRAGDVVIQRGTDHAWENRSDKIARMAFILIRGEFSEELRAKLPEELELRN
jgi:mannose-6-phosphate isomerase-like protein (cupin superfamily)